MRFALGNRHGYTARTVKKIVGAKHLKLNQCSKCLLVFLIFLLFACGGGGGASSDRVPDARNQSPRVDAGADTLIFVGQRVELIGTATDTDGRIDTYLWTQDSGDTVTLTGANTASASFLMPDKPQTAALTFTLTVTDNLGLQAFDSVTVRHDNQAPAVDVGEVQIVMAGADVRLLSAASDLDGSIASYLWAQESGDPVELMDTDTPAASFVMLENPQTSEFTFNLTVTDNLGLTASDTATVRYDNLRPVVEPVDAQFALAGSEVTLRASASDTDGSIASYQWAQNSGDSVELSNSDAAVATFVMPNRPQSAVLTFTVTVTDNLGLSGSATATVRHNNLAPAVDAGSDQTALAGAEVRLSGTAFDDDGEITAYVWSQLEGDDVIIIDSDRQEARFLFPSKPDASDFVFVVTVTDNRGAQATDRVTITHQNLPPEVSVDSSVTSGAADTVSLQSQASDDDGNIVLYAWEQIEGSPVSLISADSPAASFVLPTTPSGAMRFQLTVTDNRGAIATAELTFSAEASVTGQVTFDLVPLDTATNALDYLNTRLAPARGVIVDAVDTAGRVLASSETDALGHYTLTTVPNQQLRIRVSARMKNGVYWDVKITDNTNSNALYVGQGALFDVTVGKVTRDFHFASGWDGSRYGEARAAAPFAILDAVYETLMRFHKINDNVQFPALEMHWSEKNTPANGALEDGDIGTSFYQDGKIYILGAANSDTDEYDRHVVIHEWGHYFEDTLSRSDSIGGEHSVADQSDLRVAMSEGWGNALSAMITDDSFYRDSSGRNQSQGFSVDVENNQMNNRGWYSEASVQSILYDLYDANNDAADNIALGLNPIYAALTSENYANAPFFTSIYTFVDAIKQQLEDTAAIDVLVQAQDIFGSGGDGAGETNDGSIESTLPVYHVASVNGMPTTNLCSVLAAGSGNKLGNSVFASFTVSIPGEHSLVVTQAGAEAANADIDFVLLKPDSTIRVAESSEAGRERLTTDLAEGRYALAMYAYDNKRDICFDLQITR